MIQVRYGTCLAQVLQSLQTSERKSVNTRVSAFQGCSNHFEQLKKHPTVGWRQQKKSLKRIGKDFLVPWLHPVWII